MDELIQQLLGSPTVEMGRFLAFVFGYYRQLVFCRIRSLSPSPPSPLTPVTQAPMSPLVLLPPRRQSTLYRVLSCNNLLHRTWTTQGRVNY